jgi:TonB family protein
MIDTLRRKIPMRIGMLPIFGAVIFTASFAITQNTGSLQTKPALEVSASQTTNSETEDVALGEPFEWAQPKYPKQALDARLQGTVVLMLSVDEEGYVSKVSAISGDPQLVDAAVGTVRKWKYVPYDMNGRSVAVTTKAAFVFSISEAGRPDVSVTIRNLPKADIGPVIKVVKGVTAPKAIYSPAPQYSKRAKKDKYQGNCVLSLVVGPDGKAYDVKVSRFLGEGLDEKAIEAVRNWRFQPALKDGKPVAVAINLEVQFVLG